MELAEHLFNKLSKEEKIDCIEEALSLCYQVTSGIGLGEPYYLMLDNDVLNALQKPNNYSIRYIALILLFRTIKMQDISFSIAINPVIFFEFNGEEAFHCANKFERGWIKLKKAISQIELPVVSIGLASYKQAKSQFKSIKHDIKKLKLH